MRGFVFDPRRLNRPAKQLERDGYAVVGRMLRESHIERALVRRVEAAGGLAYKFTSPNRRSVPDRIVVLPFWSPQFVELKAPGRGLTQAQQREHQRIHKAGGITWVIDDLAGVDAFMDSYGDWVAAKVIG